MLASDAINITEMTRCHILKMLAFPLNEDKKKFGSLIARLIVIEMRFGIILLTGNTHSAESLRP